MEDAEHYTDADFVALHRDMPERQLRVRPCGDCPVVDGMYRPISDELAACSVETQQLVARRWFCHTSPRFACRGNVDNLQRRQGRA